MNYFDYRKESQELQSFDEIVMLSYTNRPAAEHLSEHLNDGIELCVAQYGIFEWVVEGKDTRIRNGEISITLPWQKHSGKESIINRGKLVFIIIKPWKFELNGKLVFGEKMPQLREIQSELGSLMVQNESPNIGKSDRFSELLLMLGQEMLEKKIGYETSVYLYLSQMMIEIYRLLRDKNQDYKGDDQRIHDAIKEMNKDICRLWSTRDLEMMTGYKKTALNKHFRDMTGFAPMHYVMNQKVEYAKLLLKEQKSITTIAYDLNFSSSQHFASVFKQYTGMTPSSYKKI